MTAAPEPPRLSLPVRPGEEPWTEDRARRGAGRAGGRGGRAARRDRPRGAAIAGLLGDSVTEAGDDEADASSKVYEREHELAISNNARELLEQTEHALARIAAGTYGVCESCGKPVGKARLLAFPRATLCVECKQRQERR